MEEQFARETQAYDWDAETIATLLKSVAPIQREEGNG